MALPTLDELLEGDLFELLGIQDASQEVKDNLVKTMLSTIDARVANRVAEELGSQGAEEFKQIADAGDPQKLSQFLVDNNIDLQKIVSEETTRHRVEIVEMFNLLKEKNAG